MLGCYHGGQHGIFLLGVSDPRLEGVQQVTAAHEMLHAAYERLGKQEREKINSLLLDYHRHGLRDERIIKTLDAYEESERVGEMHSIFGTEIDRLPGDLERYFERYFDNRSQVAAYAAQYQNAFTSRRNLMAQYEAELNRLKAHIEAAETDMNTKRAVIDARQQTLENQKNSGDLGAYNAGVPVYNALVDTYNREVQTLQSLIDEYNRLVVRRNAVLFEHDELSKELSTDSAPI